MAFSSGIVPPSTIGAAAFFVTQGSGIVVRFDGIHARLPAGDELLSLGVTPATSEYLGERDGVSLFATEIAPDAVLPAPFVKRGLRGLFGAFDDEMIGIAGRAVQVTAWAAQHRFCGRCGQRTERVAGERSMRCAACDLSFYPRIAPAVIVLVRRGDEALLARGARFPMPMYSTLAGFSEVGESLEETLAREVEEEVGIRITNARYFGSQPWPFPNSLMVGFFADWQSGELRIDPKEIVDAQWWRADALPPIPPPLSIARRLIDAWVAEVTARR